MHCFTAKVIAGKGRGRRIGFPTANLNKRNLNIEHGVYLVEAVLGVKRHFGLLHFGEKKTFNEGASLELYIKDFDFNIYNRAVKVKVIRKVREVKKFNSVQDLKKQINKDLEEID